MNTISKIKKHAIAAAQKAGRMALREYKKFNRSDIKLKARHEILTRVDLMSEKIIIKAIRKKFPDHKILSEEKGRINSRSDYFWVIDPIDGTTNFSMHNPLWSVVVGVAYKNEMVLGVIYAPVLGELWIAEKGGGATINNKKIKVSGRTKKTLHAFCHGSNERDLKKAIKYYTEQKLNELDCRQLGSASIELAYVASGRIESIMIPGANPWDVAAGALIAREAGGRVTDFSGEKWGLGSRDIVATNGKMHKEVLGAIHKAQKHSLRSKY